MTTFYEMVQNISVHSSGAFCDIGWPVVGSDLPVMMAVRERRSGQLSVTSSAAVLEPNPLGPTVPIRYLTVCSMSRIQSSCLHLPSDSDQSAM